MSIELETIKLPDKLVAFANGLAKLAAEHEIDRVDLTISPTWNGVAGDRDFKYGDIKIAYSQVDGRGRPGINLTITVEAGLTHKIVYTPESCS